MAEWMKKQEILEYEQKAFIRNKRRIKMVEAGQDTSEMDIEEENEYEILKANHPKYEKGKLSFQELLSPPGQSPAA